jgi:hypothetical protein
VTDHPCDKRRLSYAGTFTNPWKAGRIRAIEGLTAKFTRLRRICRFERDGAPSGVPFSGKAVRDMGLDILTPRMKSLGSPPAGRWSWPPISRMG